MSESKVQVAVRIRPLSVKEKQDRCTSCLEEVSATEVAVGGERRFTFDYVFGQGIGQHAVYSSCVSSLVDNLFEGYNVTVLAYGQTGSGKTFTMGSGCTDASSVSTAAAEDNELGVIPRATVHIFSLISEKRKNNPNIEFYLRVQFLELYGESLRDLLDPVGTAQGKPVTIRDGPNDSLQIVGATEETVKSPNDMLSLLERGSLCRTTGNTDMNSHSSRSHAIFSVVLEQHIKCPEGEEKETEFRIAKFHFVDLAGSERAKRTNATGQRLKEGININLGLLALGNVISALGSEEGAPKFVRYRDSKLTRMLQDSLGGNSRTLMIACVSPADVNFEETLNALRYANRARNIKNRAIVNRDPASSQIAALKAEVAALKRLLELNGGDNGDDEDASTSLGVPNHGHQSDFERRCKLAEDEVLRLAELLEREKRTRAELQDRFVLLEAERTAIFGVSTSSEEEQDSNESEEEQEEQEEEAVEEAGPGDEPKNDEDTDDSTLILKKKFQKTQKQFRKLYQNYEQTLASKEKAMLQIHEEKQKFEALKTHYESKMHEMNEEVRETQSQRDSLEQRLRELESEHQQTDVSKLEAQKLRIQLSEKDKRLRELEDRTRQLAEAKKMLSEWQKKEVVVRGEIEHLKREKVELSRKMSEAHKKFLEENKERNLEIAGLKRERQRLAAEAQLMSQRNERDGRLIQQKSEQVAAMQRKLREAQKITSYSRSLSEREKKQRLELERLAQLQIKHDEELLDLRRALAKKEEAIVRRNQLLSEVERLKSMQQEQQQMQQQSASSSSSPILVVALPPDACEEDLHELEQRLEGIDSEILYRDKQCQEVLSLDGTAHQNSPSHKDIMDSGLQLVSLDQAKEVCKVLMCMFVESKRELRERRLELDRARSQVAQQDQVFKFERRRAESLLLSPLKESVPMEAQEEQQQQQEVADEKKPSSPLVKPFLFPPRTPESESSVKGRNFASLMKIRTIEADIRSKQVEEEEEEELYSATSSRRSGLLRPPPPLPQANKSLPKQIFLNNMPKRRLLGETVLGGDRPPVFDRLSSPSGFTGIHRQQFEEIKKRQQHHQQQQQPMVRNGHDGEEEEEDVDELVIVSTTKSNNKDLELEAINQQRKLFAEAERMSSSPPFVLDHVKMTSKPPPPPPPQLVTSAAVTTSATTSNNIPNYERTTESYSHKLQENQKLQEKRIFQKENASHRSSSTFPISARESLNNNLKHERMSRKEKGNRQSLALQIPLPLVEASSQETSMDSPQQ